MGLPELKEPESFTIKELADRWGISETYVERLLRQGEFGYVIHECTLAGSPLTRHIYSDRKLWPYGKNDHYNISSSEVANFSENYKWPPNGNGVYIPRKTVKDFELKHDVRPVAETAPLVTTAFAGIQSNLLHIAAEAYNELYTQKKIRPTKKSHKAQIREWLNKHHPTLTDRTKESIATLVNQNKKGGAPRSS